MYLYQSLYLFIISIYYFWIKIKEVSKQFVLFGRRLCIYLLVTRTFCGVLFESGWFQFSWRAESQLNFVLTWCQWNQKLACSRSVSSSSGAAFPARWLPHCLYSFWRFLSPGLAVLTRKLYPCTQLDLHVSKVQEILKIMIFGNKVGWIRFVT